MKKMALKKFQRDLKMEETVAKIEIVVLGGVGFNSYRNFKVLAVQTPYGEVTAYHNTIRGKKLRSFPGTQGKIIFLLIESITERIYGPYMPLGQNV
jgi:hypothetical protein